MSDIFAEGFLMAIRLGILGLLRKGQPKECLASTAGKPLIALAAGLGRPPMADKDLGGGDIRPS